MAAETIDYSKLSDEDLNAIVNGDYSKIPDPILIQMANQPESTAAAGKEQTAKELNANRAAGAIIGGAIGGKYVSPVVGGTYLYKDIASKIKQLPSTTPAALEEAKLDRAIQGTMKEPGVTGRASQTTYNVITQQRAEEARKQKQLVDEMVRKGIISESKIPTAVASTPSGVLTTERLPAPTPIEKAKAAAKWMGAPTGVGGKIFNTLSPVASLAGAGALGMEALTRMQHGDVGRGIVSGIGALGSAASAIPFPLTRAIGTGVALGAPALNYLVDTAMGRSGYSEGGLAHYASGGHATPAWQRKEGQNPEGGLNAAGRASYHAETGGTLKPPQPEGGKRKDAFCKRMKGMKKKLTSAETAKDPDSRINKSLRAWNC